MRQTGPLDLVLVGLTAGLQADKIRLDCAIVKILYRLNYLDFYFADIIAKLLANSDRSAFSLLFSNKAYFRVCFLVHKIWSSFFHVNRYY